MIAPHPFGHSITLLHITDLFAKQKNDNDRYRQLVLLSRQLPTLDNTLKTSDIEVKGCENRVWLGAEKSIDSTFHFYGDSDGRLIKGVLAVLLAAVEGKTAEKIANIDLQALLHQLGISRQLSTSRQNGLDALICRIRQVR